MSTNLPWLDPDLPQIPFDNFCAEKGFENERRRITLYLSVVALPSKSIDGPDGGKLLTKC